MFKPAVLISAAVGAAAALTGTAASAHNYMTTLRAPAGRQRSKIYPTFRRFHGLNGPSSALYGSLQAFHAPVSVGMIGRGPAIDGYDAGRTDG